MIYRSTIHLDARTRSAHIDRAPNIEGPDGLALVAELRLALQRFEQTSDRIVRRCGLTPRQHLLILVLEGRHGGSASIGTLADELLLAQSTVTELADRSQASGLVRRVVSRDDARVVLVRTTAEGRTRLGRALAALEGEREGLGAAMARLGAVLSRHETSGRPGRKRCSGQEPPQ